MKVLFAQPKAETKNPPLEALQAVQEVQTEAVASSVSEKISELFDGDSPLQARCMLVRLNTGCYGGETKDRILSRHLYETYGIKDESMARATKSILRKGVSHVRAIVEAGRRDYYARSLPYGSAQDGWRLMPTVKIREFLQDFDGSISPVQDNVHGKSWRARIAEAIGFFGEHYEEFIQADRMDLEAAFNINDYPDFDVIRKRYAFSISVQPLPDAGNLIVDLEREELDRLKSRMQATVEAEIQKSMLEVWDRLEEHVGALAENLAGYGTPLPNAKRQGAVASFKQASIDNAVGAARDALELNVVGDDELSWVARNVIDLAAGEQQANLKQDDTRRKYIAGQISGLSEAIARARKERIEKLETGSPIPNVGSFSQLFKAL